VTPRDISILILFLLCAVVYGIATAVGSPKDNC
jgi:hypothetical protein